MRFKTLEIRWHDSKAISSCDFQPVPVFKKARPSGLGSSDISQQEWTEKWASQSYRLATGGDDNHVRVWMVHPNIRPTTAATEASTSTTQTAPRPPRIEYLATLSKHSAPVNVVRWSPNGETIASAGDDGMIIIWAPSSTPQASAYGSDVNPDEMSNEKEFWKPRIMVRCTSMEVYDLAWSPTGEYIIAGSTDNAARIFHAADGKCLHEIADHTHFVQGVSWDPLNEYIATQSSDRAMHVHRITHNHHGGSLEIHAVGKNSHMSLQTGSQGRGHRRKHERTSSVVSNTSHTEGRRESSRPRFSRRESMTSDVESVFEESGAGSALFSSTTPEIPREKEFKDPTPLTYASNAPITPSTSVASTPVIPPMTGTSSLPPLTVPPITTSLSTSSTSSMLPPPSTPVEKDKGHIQPSSRRSSFSNASNAPASPAYSITSRYGRSPSPMPALPAIRTAIPTSHSYPTPSSRTGTDQWRNIGLYGDESYTNFFRRLTFSPDGALLVTPAGQFEDPEVVILPTPSSEEGSTTPARGRKSRTEEASAAGGSSKGGSSSSCVYIYTRANFAKPPIATLPGHKKASVAVKFNPVLIELREALASSQEGSSTSRMPKTAPLSTEVVQLDVDVTGPLQVQSSQVEATSTGMGMTLLPPSQRTPTPTIASPSPRHANAADPGMRPLTPAASKPNTPSQQHSTPTAVAPNTASVFALPYRMLFAVITMDAVVIYDTQQSTPICILTKLHYDEFTDASWSPDGQSLMLSSRDGYCTLIVFDEIFPAYHKQQQALQLQSIAQQHSVPIAPVPSSSSQHGGSGASRAGTPTATPVFGNVGLPPAPVAPSTGFVRSVTPSPAPTAVKARINAMDQPPATPSGSISDVDSGAKRTRDEESTPENNEKVAEQPPKKKRRVALTRVGDVGS
ncbi:Chromatin assembly factor 1 subunit [Paramarasmius palmivorus]|uniref:Chromatin assembly factor 1 subunit n=1 Tax=Paramarasmius palmivorus TaxID=297713 RepID=A0AAW0EEZ5_9AGAR